VYLLDAATDLERRLLSTWARRVAGSPVDTVPIVSSRRGRGGETEPLAQRLAAGDDPFLIPLRVVWMAPNREGKRPVGWSELFKPGDPRDPRGLRAYWIRVFRPGRIRLVAGSGALASHLEEQYHGSGEVDGLAAFVTRRAWLALDQVERRLRGNRFKVPRFIPEAILSRRDFLDAIDAYAAASGVGIEAARANAERYLHEIAATHSTYVIDLIANAIHALYTQGYGRIDYRKDEIGRIAELGQGRSVVFLPSHRSNLDRLSLQFLLWENDLPPNHTAGGVNLNFFPIGPLLRRTGVFFIRRSFRDNELYKIVLRAYIDLLVEKRFPIEWYLEGGRSRSGKLGPPRFGLLQYVVDAYRRGKTDEVVFIPVSIAYDQIQDVPDYAREAQGRSKEKESIGWLVKAVRSLRRRYGDIYVRFGEPVLVSNVTVPGSSGEEAGIELQKLAFEVMYRIGRVTPVTPTAIISIALLAARGHAKTPAELAADCAGLVGFLLARKVEMTEDIDFSTPAAVVPVLDWLVEQGDVSSHEAAGRRVFWLDEDQMIRVSYYRNVVVHYFIPRAIAEMSMGALLDEATPDPDVVRRQMEGLRDLLKFEFFFPDRSEFVDQVADDLGIDVPDWEGTLRSSGPLAVLAGMGTPVAYWAVLPFLDAYQIVGDELEDSRGGFDEKAFLKRCLSRARLYRIEERLISGESASQVLFKSALALARNRGLLTEAPELAERRAAFAAEIREARRVAARGL
jgi:glycerol-3-phosphate O-acyltransferase